jgi:lipid-A-disaccharide synthase-like uncharacterized protein
MRRDPHDRHGWCCGRSFLIILVPDDRLPIMEYNMLWIAVGFIGQMLFSARFFVQWLTSERLKRSVVPLAFWYLSLAGGATLLAYAIHRRDPVFIVGQLGGLFVYFRNLQLIYRQRRDGMVDSLGKS